MTKEERMYQMGEKIVDLCDTFSDLPPYEVGVRMIAQATNMMLSCAPNHLVAMKTAMAAIEIGISEFQEQQQQ